MNVYRYVSEKELQMILNGETKELGTVFSDGVYSNSHNYKHKVKYLHFFLNKQAIDHIKSLYKDCSSNFYIATFDIPVFTLLCHAGNGVYLPLTGGYDYDTEKRIEFAVPVKKFKPSSLVSYELDKKHQKHIRSLREKSTQADISP